ncbi:MAG: hypothetical protein WCJ18_01280 [Planctomycetota bacterium]
MPIRNPLAVVLIASITCLTVGFAATPFWDEDEPRFAAIAQTMLDTGNWIVPMYNDTLAVDKPVLMHWCMAACYRLFGVSEIPARIPSALAALATALALLRAGKRASYAELATDLGHDSFLLESEELYTLIRGFLERSHTPAVDFSI